MRYYPELPAPRTRAILGDIAVIVLIVLFAWLGMKVNNTVDDLASLGRGVQDAGTSVQKSFDQAGSVIGDVPIVGGSLKDALTQAGRQTGGNAVALGKQGETAVEDTAKLLGWVDVRAADAGGAALGDSAPRHHACAG